jgi:hypothetical protein
MSKIKTECPHCGVKMKKWETPGWTTWGGRMKYVCFNDECTYYVRGWEWMYKSQKAQCSYRHQMDPETGACGPLPVNTAEAGKEGIIPDD